ncbi:MAG TPA: ABC transporter permease [Pseudobdellovibrionaceae bacterium]|nr:ABC transporter permease [Pseudobdellovibrionaceae bacterium]
MRKDSSTTSLPDSHKGVQTRLQTLAKVLGPLLIVGVGLEVAVRAEWISPFVLPRPTDVLKSLVNDRVELLDGLHATAMASSLALGVSASAAMVMALIMSQSRWARQALLPYAVFFQTVPIIALAPMLVIWFGFGFPTALASAVVASFFPVLASALAGLDSADSAWVDLFRLHRASAWQELVKLRLPAALPYVFAGLRVSAGLAVIGCIVGEFIGGGGLGSVIDAARTQQKLDKVFAAVFLSSALGFFMIGVVDQLAKWSLSPWHVSARDQDA